MFTAIEFFAGSGLVRLGLSQGFKSLWANDVCSKKRDTYVATMVTAHSILRIFGRFSEMNCLLQIWHGLLFPAKIYLSLET
jgi:site-specific DNA-cytosine methylase